MINGFNRNNPLHLLAFGLGAGLSPLAPGTAGTLVAIPLFPVSYTHLRAHET